MPYSPLLTAREEAFAIAYAETRSYSLAYRSAYEPPASTTDKWCKRYGKQIYDREDVQERVKAIIVESTKGVSLTLEEALRYFLMIATADVSELINNEVGACRRCWGENHGYQWRDYEYFEALDAATKDAGPEAKVPEWAGGVGYDASREPNGDCPACHGRGVDNVVLADTRNLSPQARLLYGGVEKTRNGTKIIIADRQKAFENACRLAGLFQDNVKLGGAVGAMIAQVDMEKAGTYSPEQLASAYMSMIKGQLTIASK